VLENLRNESEESINYNNIPNNNLSLRKLVLWTLEPMERLKWLAIVIDSIKDNSQGSYILS
jgi:hypothetical protein